MFVPRNIGRQRDPVRTRTHPNGLHRSHMEISRNAARRNADEAVLFDVPEHVRAAQRAEVKGIVRTLCTRPFEGAELSLYVTGLFGRVVPTDREWRSGPALTVRTAAEIAFLRHSVEFEDEFSARASGDDLRKAHGR